MLISDSQVKRTDPILSMVAMVNKRSDRVIELIPGAYEIGHFGGAGIQIKRKK